MFENRNKKQQELIAQIRAYDERTVVVAQSMLGFAAGRYNMPRSEGSLRALVSACEYTAKGGSEKKWKHNEQQKAERWFYGKVR